jgi:hypothetical protein
MEGSVGFKCGFFYSVGDTGRLIKSMVSVLEKVEGSK